MRSSGSCGVFAVLLAVFAVLVAAGSGGALGAPKPVAAPLNPQFVQYMEDRAAGRIQAPADGKEGLGYIPPPFWFPNTSEKATFPGKPRLGLPATYDLRTIGKLTAVRDQSQCGACWAFASLGSMESSLLPGETADFSENHLKNTHGFDWSCCNGGNLAMAIAYMARWGGPVWESDDPYAFPSCASPAGLARRKHAQDALVFANRANSLDNDTLKQAVINYGAVYTTFFYAEGCYSSATRGYYDNVTGAGNHAVCIVGWDDNFDKSKFPTTAPGNGAFLVRNSWGSGWGDGGYFYVSYYDANFGKENGAFISAESPTRFTRIYQYDPFGSDSALGYTNQSTGWMANVFTAAWDEALGAASFHALTPNTTYELRVYLDPDAGSAVNSVGPALTLNGSWGEAGYHTVSFPAPVNITRGHKFSIVVQVTTPGYNYPMAIETPIPGYCSAASANPGESFISNDGAAWTDLTTVYPQTNFCIKAFAPGVMPVVSANPKSITKVLRQGETAQSPVTLGNAGAAGAQALSFTVDAGASVATYSWKDSSQVGGPSFNWIDASSGTALTGLGDDNVVGPEPIGFSFPYYGASYTQFWVGSNGLIGFGPDTGLDAFANTAIPSTDTPNNMICWQWDDLVERPDSRVTYQNVAQGLVIELANYGCYSATNARITAQVLLKPTGEILIQYSNVTADWPTSTATVGIENADGTAATQVAFNTSYARSGLALQFAPVPTFFQVSPLSGSVSPGASTPLNVTFTTAGLPMGTYAKSFTINSTDPLTPQVKIALELQISGRIYSTTGGFVKRGMWNLVSVPADPISPVPGEVFSAIDVPNASFQFWKNATSDGYQLYGSTFGWTGPIQRATPYWFIETGPGSDRDISYAGTPPDSDYTLTIPAHAAAPFWIMFGTPFADPVPASSIAFQNLIKTGSAWLSWEAAYSNTNSTLRLVESNCQGWDAAAQRFSGVTPPAFGGEKSRFDPWWGYWLLVTDPHELKILFPKP